MLIAVVGKPNSGKTTFFSAATLVDAEISSRVFTTINPNKGVSFVKIACACKELGVSCNPKNSKCVNGERFIPVKLIDIAGLVPDAHKGKGLGNQFLSEIMEASALIHVIDLSGGTDTEGNIVERGSHEPKEDMVFLENEINYWILGILKKNWDTIKRKSQASHEKLDAVLAMQLSGLAISQEDIQSATKERNITFDSSEEDLLSFIEILRNKSKPLVTAGNKIDIPLAEKNLEKLNSKVIPCSAESELALRKAAEAGLIKYFPGNGDFEIIGNIDEKKSKALNFIKINVLEKFGSTGVQKAINTAVFGLLKMIVVYPVENENRFTNKKGDVLPDALLVTKGTTAKQLAGKIHTDFGEKFLAAIDAKSKKRISADHELNNGDVIKIVLKK